MIWGCFFRMLRSFFPMSLTSQQIRSIAHLARLELPAAELSVHADTLGRILDMASRLEKVDTGTLEPMAHPLEGQVQRLRADVATSGNQRERYQRNAPQVEDGLYLVPRVIE